MIGLGGYYLLAGDKLITYIYIMIYVMIYMHIISLIYNRVFYIILITIFYHNDKIEIAIYNKILLLLLRGRHPRMCFSF